MPCTANSIVCRFGGFARFLFRPALKVSDLLASHLIASGTLCHKIAHDTASLGAETHAIAKPADKFQRSADCLRDGTDKSRINGIRWGIEARVAQSPKFSGEARIDKDGQQNRA